MSEKIQYTKELLKPSTSNFERRKVNTFFNNDIWTADLIDYSTISSQNKNYKYLLCVIDIYSRYAFVFPLKDKKGSTILNEFKKFDTYPKKLWVDKGSEFINKEFKNFCKSKGIDLYHTYGENKAVFAERFNRTLKNKLSEYMIANNTNTYINVLNDVVENYNNTKHTTTQMKPVDIYLHNKPSKDISIDVIHDKPKFKVGDFVRISRIKNTFEKGYTPKWSKEVFRISDVDNLHPVLYELEDQLGEKIQGKFYEKELQKTNLQDYAVIDKIIKSKKVNGKKMFYVKFDGYDDKFNEWLDENQIQDLI